MTWTAPILLAAVIPAAVLATPSELGRCSTSPAPEPTLRPSAPEAEPEPIARYLFDAGAGRRVADVSAVSPALDLQLVEPGAQWLDGGGLRFTGDAARSVGAASKLIDATDHSEEITVEAWVRSDRIAQEGPARIATISFGTRRDQVDLHLGQQGSALSVRVRATCGPFNWTTFPGVFTSRTDPRHVAMTFADSVRQVYVQGEDVGSELFDGRLGSSEGGYPLVVGKETTMNRPFRRDVLALAIYDEALPTSTIARHAVASPAAPRLHRSGR
jgi:hypothetical protein